jgi:hypothetical protein
MNYYAAVSGLAKTLTPGMVDRLPPVVSAAGLPDGSFSNQKSQFGQILEGLTIENDGLFYGHLEYMYCGHLVYFMAMW